MAVRIAKVNINKIVQIYFSIKVTYQTSPQQYFTVVLFIILYVVLTFESMGEILECEYSKESSSAVRNSFPLSWLLFPGNSESFESLDELKFFHNNSNQNVLICCCL